MLTYDEHEKKLWEFRIPDRGRRATGKTFRVMNEAAQRASIGDRVVLFCNTQRAARDLRGAFLDTYRRWSFYPVLSTIVRQRHNDGLVLFRGFPDKYEYYQKIMRGNNVYAIYDV